MIKKILLFLIPFLITTFLVVGYFKLTQKISTINIPSLPNISFSDLVKVSRFSLSKAPSESLVGDITNMQGIVKFQDRVATESAILTSPIVDVQQGESFETGSNGSFGLAFPSLSDNPKAEITVSPNTNLNIVQTLPADLVFSQTTGVAEYRKLADIPVTIRSLHLLIEDDGDITITLDDSAPFVTVVVNSGSATVAYNNISNISRVLTVNAGQKLTFNDHTRRVVIKNN